MRAADRRRKRAIAKIAAIVTLASLVAAPLWPQSIAITGPATVVRRDSMTLRATTRSSTGIVQQRTNVVWYSLDRSVAFMTFPPNHYGHLAIVHGVAFGDVALVATWTRYNGRVLAETTHVTVGTGPPVAAEVCFIPIDSAQKYGIGPNPTEAQWQQEQPWCIGGLALVPHVGITPPRGRVAFTRPDFGFLGQFGVATRRP